MSSDQKATQSMHLGRKRITNIPLHKQAKINARFVQRARNTKSLFDYETIAEEFIYAAVSNDDLRIVSIKFN
jgi:hypothetical protein